MLELADRLAGLDEAASESVRVIAQFDTLVEQHSSVENLTRAAASLVDAPVGVLEPERRVCIRVGANGDRRDDVLSIDELPEAWPTVPIAESDGIVWIERRGPARNYDILVLQRTAVAVRVTLERVTGALSSSSAAIEALVKGDADADGRRRAAKMLGLDPSASARVLACPPGPRHQPRRNRATVLPTPVGPVEAVIEVCGAGFEGTPSETAIPRVGVGLKATIMTLDVSWRAALVALRLTSRFDPQVRADQLGPLLLLGEAFTSNQTLYAEEMFFHLAAEPWALEAVRALVVTDSVRAAARSCFVHHSTMQARCDHISAALAYDATTPRGRQRLGLDLAAYWLSTNRFDYEDR